MGIGLLWGSMGMGMMHGPWLPLLPLILVLVGRAWRKRITYPCLGYAEIVHKKRTTRKRSMLLIVLTALLVLALLYRAFLRLRTACRLTKSWHWEPAWRRSSPERASPCA